MINLINPLSLKNDLIFWPRFAINWQIIAANFVAGSPHGKIDYHSFKSFLEQRKVKITTYLSTFMYRYIFTYIFGKILWTFLHHFYNGPWECMANDRPALWVKETDQREYLF